MPRGSISLNVTVSRTAIHFPATLRESLREINRNAGLAAVNERTLPFPSWIQSRRVSKALRYIFKAPRNSSVPHFIIVIHNSKTGGSVDIYFSRGGIDEFPIEAREYINEKHGGTGLLRHSVYGIRWEPARLSTAVVPKWVERSQRSRIEFVSRVSTDQESSRRPIAPGYGVVGHDG